MNTPTYDWLDEPDEAVDQCSDCPHPNGCIRECIIATYEHEAVAKIRNEEQH
jgi:hypothetical protein